MYQMKELLSCPHCGGEAVFVPLSGCNGYIACVGDCGIHTGDYWSDLNKSEGAETWKEKAVRDWNRRVN